MPSLLQSQHCWRMLLQSLLHAHSSNVWGESGIDTWRDRDRDRERREVSKEKRGTEEQEQQEKGDIRGGKDRDGKKNGKRRGEGRRREERTKRRVCARMYGENHKQR